MARRRPARAALSQPVDSLAAMGTIRCRKRRSSNLVAFRQAAVGLVQLLDVDVLERQHPHVLTNRAGRYMSDAWVWDMYRPARFVKNVRVLTFKDVNVEELDKPDLRLPEGNQFGS